MNDELETLQRLGRERRLTIGRQEHSGNYVVFNRNGHAVHLGQFADAEAFLKNTTVKQPDPDTKLRILIAASNKRGFFVETIGEDEYRLSLKRGARTVIFDSVNFAELIEWLDKMEIRQ